MRELIAPAAQWLLRLSLFLALLAWLQAQWWRVVVQFDPIGIGLTQDGWAMVLGNGGANEFSATPVADVPRLDEFYLYPSPLLEVEPQSGFQFAGMAVNHYSNGDTMIGLRHATICGLVLFGLIIVEVATRRRLKPVDRKIKEPTPLNRGHRIRWTAGSVEHDGRNPPVADCDHPGHRVV